MPMPESRIFTPSALCELGMRPHLMTGVIRQLLLQHFADRSNLESDVLREANDEGNPLGDYLWRAGDTSGILIESVTRWLPDQADGKPAVIIKRNSWSVQRRGINDMHQGHVVIDGFDRYTTFMSGSHTLFAITQEAGEAELLAAEVYKCLVGFGPIIRKSLQILRFVIAEVGGLAQLKDTPQPQFVVPIVVAYAHEESWALKQHVPRLKKITLEPNILRP
jgi:hypothetical protein